MGECRGARRRAHIKAPRCVARSCGGGHHKPFPSWPAPPALAPTPSAAVLISVLQGVTAPPSPQARERPQAAHCGSIEGLEQEGEAAETTAEKDRGGRGVAARLAGRRAARLPARRPGGATPSRRPSASK